MSFHRFIFLCFYVLVSLTSWSQEYIFSKEIDSTIKILKFLPPDTNKVIVLNNIVDQLWKKSQLDSALVYANKTLVLAEKIDYLTGKGNVLTSIGIIYAIKGDYPQATSSMKSSLDIFVKLKNKPKIASVYNNLGNIYEKQGNYKQALEHHLKSLKLKEELGDTLAMASSYNNIGIILKYEGNFEKALEYYNKSLEINIKAKKNKSITQSYTNIGGVYQQMIRINYKNESLYTKEELYDICTDNYFKALEMSRIEDNKVGEAIALNNVASIFFMMGNYNAALDYNMQALSLREEIGDKSGISGTKANLSQVYLKLNNNKEAKNQIIESLNLALEIGAKDRIKNSYRIISEVDSALGNYKEAYLNYKLYTLYLDSLVNEENTINTTQMQMQFEFDKKAAEDSVLNANLQAIQKAEIDKQNAELDKKEAEINSKRNQQYALFGGLVLFLIFSGFIYNRFRVTRKQNRLIEIQKKQVEQKNILVEKAHNELSEKNSEIMDSINYAERIQRSFLASKEMLSENLKDYFVFFQPKDVVSGDFYWTSQLKNSNFAFCCADSTGHGVPGAIMSILNISSLEKAIEKETEPHHILGKTRELIIERLKNDGSPEGGKDGMDCSLLILNQDKTQLTFASANNPVFIVRKTPHLPSGEDKGGVASDPELIEFKPDKMPVGKHDKDQMSFTLQMIQLQKGDVIYTFTDGFSDQFGGEKGKKYMIKNLKSFLLRIAHLTMEEQKSKLNEEFSNWKGENEQVDDVCIIGVRI
jgi:serine phosphatase RsbU (regulator of sigma subunit)/Tfp pilus assembly protein PilF